MLFSAACLEVLRLEPPKGDLMIELIGLVNELP